MIDWHSHILPAMDDGSRDIAESLSMLRALREQGVACVVATPHFYANDESVQAFLARRNQAYDQLHQSMQEDLPQVLCGAEVRYYPGISRMADLNLLKIDSTNLLLLEMPSAKWTEYTVRELGELAGSRELSLVLAHAERYAPLQSHKVMNRLLQNGVLIQANATFFNRFGTRRKALNLLHSGRIHFIGSDCHNMTTRPPQIGRAHEFITQKLGPEFIPHMCHFTSLPSQVE